MLKNAIGIDNNKEKIEQAKKFTEENNLKGEKFLCKDILSAKIDDATSILCSGLRI